MIARTGINAVFPCSQMFLKEMHKNLRMVQLMSDEQGHTQLKSEQILYSIKLLCETLLWGPSLNNFYYQVKTWKSCLAVTLMFYITCGIKTSEFNNQKGSGEDTAIFSNSFMVQNTQWGPNVA